MVRFTFLKTGSGFQGARVGSVRQVRKLRMQRRGEDSSSDYSCSGNGVFLADRLGVGHEERKVKNNY